MVVIAAVAGSASGVPCSWAGAGGTKNIPPGLSPHTSRRGVTRPGPGQGSLSHLQHNDAATNITTLPHRQPEKIDKVLK